MDEPTNHWVFGYGSLIWRPDFEFRRRTPARLKGWTRRFWQWSVDHRGVPGNPGRVVTLVPNARGHVLGAAFEVESQVYERVMAELDYREKGGYERVHTTVASSLGPLDIITYVGAASNRNYAGPAPIEEIAATIVASVGPSGANIDYLTELSDALRAQGECDDHVEALRAAVERIARR